MARSLKNLIVDSDMQKRMTLYFVAINVCAACISLLIILNEVQHLRNVLENTPGLSYQGHQDLANALIAIIGTSIICMIVTIAINVIAGLYISHRFAGPMKVINDFIDQLIDGRATDRRQLRPNDELKPIMTKLHKLADRLEKKKSG